MRKSFSHVTDWVFDLDNTLYPSSCDLFVQMDKRITQYVMQVTGKDHDEAYKEQKLYYREHGTTLRGLMSVHGVDPQDYLNSVHDIDYSPVKPNRELGDLIKSLPGRKHIFTNGDIPHVERTIAALEFGNIFNNVFGIVEANFVPKPERGPYVDFLERHDVDPKSSAMFEDMARNLKVPKALGMSTVLLVPAADEKSERQAWEHQGQDAEYVDHVSDDLNGFVERILKVI